MHRMQSGGWPYPKGQYKAACKFSQICFLLMLLPYACACNVTLCSHVHALHVYCCKLEDNRMSVVVF